MENERINLIDYKGFLIHIIDYSGFIYANDFMNQITKVDAFNREQIEKGRTDFLILSDLTNSYVFGEPLQKLRESGNIIKNYVKKTALLGINNPKKTLLNTTNLILRLNIKPFNSKEEALEWLIS